MKKDKNLLAFLCGTVVLLSSIHAADAVPETEKPDHECTSWMVFPDLTKNNTLFLHKNRDSSIKTIAVFSGEEKKAEKAEKGFWAKLFSCSDTESKVLKRKWVGSGNMTNGRFWVCMGMNTSGLAGVMNSGEKCTENNTDKTKKDSSEVLQDVLETCDTAQEAVARLKVLLKAGDYYHGVKGSIFFFLDTNEGYVCEITARYCSAVRYDNGYTFRANIWHNPGLAQRSDNTLAAFINSSVREYVTLTSLNQALRKNGKITVADSLALARNIAVPADSPNPRSVCSKFTNASSTLVIDREFPAVLSTGYHNIGQPRHGICVPFPICIEKIDQKIVDLTWSRSVWKRFGKLGVAAPIPESWLAFEKKSHAEYGKCIEKARLLLRDGKKEEAVKLLNDKTAAICKEAAKLMGI